MICNTILDAMGHTPLVRLNRMTTPDMAEVLVKFEALNVGGSIKTRTAYNMIRDAEARGLLKPDSVIVEPTSGNQGIGLALVGAVKGYRTVIVMPDSVSEERRKLVRHYGAEVVLVHDAGNIGDAIAECCAIAQRMAKEDPKVFVPEQFSNPANPAAHRHGTALEIMEQNPGIEIWAVEPQNAAILAGGTVGTHLQMGIGDGLIPDNLNTQIYSHICVVTDDEALGCARDLASKEGLLAGISAGTNVFAALKLAKRLGPGKTVVTVLPDTAERYFSTPLFDEPDAR